MILISLSRFLSNMNSTQIGHLNVECNVPSTIFMKRDYDVSACWRHANVEFEA